MDYCCPQNDWLTHPCIPPPVALPLNSLLYRARMFLVGCCVVYIIPWRPPKARMYYILLIFSSCKSSHQTIGRCPPTRSPPLRASTLTSPPPLPPNIVGCWVLWSIRSHLRPEPGASLYFLMLLCLVPQTRQPTMASANPTPRASYPGPIGSSRGEPRAGAVVAVSMEIEGRAAGG